jgi:hypothetical protein
LNGKETEFSTPQNSYVGNSGAHRKETCKGCSFLVKLA